LLNWIWCSVAVFLGGLLWNCAVPLPLGGRAWLSLYLPRLRNGRKPARSSMFRIVSTRCLSQLRGWSYLYCFGFDVEKWGTENRISRALRTFLLRIKKSEKLAVSIPRARNQSKYKAGDIRAN